MRNPVKMPLIAMLSLWREMKRLAYSTISAGGSTTTKVHKIEPRIPQRGDANVAEADEGATYIFCS